MVYSTSGTYILISFNSLVYSYKDDINEILFEKWIEFKQDAMADYEMDDDGNYIDENGEIVEDQDEDFSYDIYPILKWIVYDEMEDDPYRNANYPVLYTDEEYNTWLKGYDRRVKLRRLNEINEKKSLYMSGYTKRRSRLYRKQNKRYKRAVLYGTV